MRKKHNPFLWHFVINVTNQNEMSGGQERPFTKTVAEESTSNIIDLE